MEMRKEDQVQKEMKILPSGSERTVDIELQCLDTELRNAEELTPLDKLIEHADAGADVGTIPDSYEKYLLLLGRASKARTPTSILRGVQVVQ